MSRALLRIFLASLLRRRLATALSLVAIALGVALGLAVQLIHGAALDEFGRGMRLISGEADLQVVGPRGGFDDSVYLELAQREEVAWASPVVEVEARLPEHDENLRVFGIDLFRIAVLSPKLMPAVDRRIDDGERASLAALREDALFLSAAARARLGVEPGAGLVVQSGLNARPLTIRGSVPGAGLGQAFGVMDIAAAQKVFDRIGRLSRVDLRLRAGVEREQARAALAAGLPAGLSVLAPEAAESQAASLSRAYRVNLTMLAAIALLTGGFLVFSTQVLAVVRRRREFAFLRALGLSRQALFGGLLAEGGALGLIGGALGVGFAYVLTALAFRFVGGDLGAGYFAGIDPSLRFDPLLSAVYLALGALAGLAGAWLPAREAANMRTARALRAGDDARVFEARSRTGLAVAVLLLAGLLCGVPPVCGIPVAGYAAVLLILIGAVLAMPGAVRVSMRVFERGRAVTMRLAHARLAAMPGQTVVAGAGVVASVALAVSMAIMVSSFRGSVDDWLAQVLPADLYVRASSSAASGYLGPDALAQVRALPGVAAVQPVRFDTVRVTDGRAAMTLIARPVRGSAGLPLVSGTRAPELADGQGDPVWISEAMADLQGLAVGQRVDLPIGGRMHRFTVAGVWRDYARQHGALVIERDDYVRLTGDRRINDFAISLAPGVASEPVMAALRDMFGAGAIEIALPGEIRATSLRIFDRTFLVTYLMEAVAVLIGLFGIGTTFAALTASRRQEFGMLRHLGMMRAELVRLVAMEGAMTAAVGFALGTVAGVAIAWILVEVINRQSFHWSMDISLPVGALGAFGLVLVALAGLTAALAGHRTMRQSAVLAVREDW